MSSIRRKSARQTIKKPIDPFQQVRIQYSDLEDAVSELPNRLNLVAKNFENQFLLAYRVQIRNIQEELKVLNDKLRIAHEELNDNIEVSRLESVVQWFKHECNYYEDNNDL